MTRLELEKEYALAGYIMRLMLDGEDVQGAARLWLRRMKEQMTIDAMENQANK